MGGKDPAAFLNGQKATFRFQEGGQAQDQAVLRQVAEDLRCVFVGHVQQFVERNPAPHPCGHGPVMLQIGAGAHLAVADDRHDPGGPREQLQGQAQGGLKGQGLVNPGDVGKALEAFGVEIVNTTENHRYGGEQVVSDGK